MADNEKRSFWDELYENRPKHKPADEQDGQKNSKKHSKKEVTKKQRTSKKK